MYRIHPFDPQTPVQYFICLYDFLIWKNNERQCRELSISTSCCIPFVKATCATFQTALAHPSSPSALCDTLVACKYKYIHICMYFMCHVFVTNIRMPSGIWWACCTCCCCWCLGFAATICGLRKMFLLSLCALLIDFPCENTESCCCLWYF